MSDTQPHVPMIVCPRPFTLEGRQQKTFSPGMSIADLLRQFDLDPVTVSARVFIDDKVIPQAYWHRIRPKANHLVSVRVLPQGGGGQGKDVLRIVAMVGVIALAITAPYLLPASFGLVGSLGGALLTAGIGIAGSLAINGLIPNQLPRRAVPLPIPQEHRRLAA